MKYGELIELLENNPEAYLVFNDGVYVAGAHVSKGDVKLFRADGNGWDFDGDFDPQPLEDDSPLEARIILRNLSFALDDDRDAYRQVVTDFGHRRYTVFLDGYDDNGDIVLEIGEEWYRG